MLHCRPPCGPISCSTAVTAGAAAGAAWPSCFGITVLRVQLLLLPCCAAKLCRSSCLLPALFFKVITPWLFLKVLPISRVPPSNCCGWRCCWWCCCSCSWLRCWCQELPDRCADAAPNSCCCLLGDPWNIRNKWCFQHPRFMQPLTHETQAIAANCSFDH